MDITEEIEEVKISPIIQIFERLTFERGHDLHDQVSSMIELFSLSDVSFYEKQTNKQKKEFLKLDFYRLH